MVKTTLFGRQQNLQDDILKSFQELIKRFSLIFRACLFHFHDFPFCLLLMFQYPKRDYGGGAFCLKGSINPANNRYNLKDGFEKLLLSLKDIGKSCFWYLCKLKRHLLIEKTKANNSGGVWEHPEP